MSLFHKNTRMIGDPCSAKVRAIEEELFPTFAIRLEITCAFVTTKRVKIGMHVTRRRIGEVLVTSGCTHANAILRYSI